MGRFAASGPKGFKPDVLQARSSGVERYIDTVEVGGSKPPVPTIPFLEKRFILTGEMA